MSVDPVVLTVHAVDTLGEEGVTADAAALTELHCRPVQVVTSILVASQERVGALEGLSLSLVAEQFESLAERARPRAARIGILRDALQVELVATLLRECGVASVVVAPIVRIGGARILDDATIEAMRRLLFPLAAVVLVRAGDLPVMAGERGRELEGIKRGAAALRAQGARAALVAGAAWGDRVLDVLDDGGPVAVFDASRILAPRVAGAGGVHAAALAGYLARGESLRRAVDASQRYVALRLQRAR
ncbi:MAG: hydroxymethylpyrimidine/phosphomethylpyrimidine kinase [Acidobacteriia bacterium]|nr:hydroxymethylpyrimidine/phosphomethylpyrimidine kinase [Terriglobia bacterium]